VGVLVRRTIPVLALLLAGWGAVANAHEGDTFRPFVSYASYFDSNLFRLAENESPATPRDDRYNVLSAGLNVDWKPGRQQIVANATKTLVRYNRNIFLDYDGADYQATWNWRLGNHLSGNLGASESLSQSSFDNLGQINNQVTRKRNFGRAEWEFHPRWRIGAGSEQSDNTNSAPSQISQDFQQQSYDVALTYLTPKGSNVSLQARQSDAKYPNRQIFFLVPVDNSYKQTDINLSGDWRVSGKLTARAQIGQSERKNANVPQRDFKGFTGRLSGDWYPTGKTLLSVSAYQELGSADDLNATSVLSKGASLNGVWLVREKWRLNAGATFVNRDFQGDPGGFFSGGLRRNDDTLGASLSLSYTPIRAVSLDVGLSAGRRDSNKSDENYKFHSLFANVRADF
jgi:exopolysaccharide biosynthesis operon protein EpsL